MMRTKEEYQEALDFISDNTKPDVKSAKDLESLEFFYNKIEELIDLYPEYLELKKRDTPMKPKTHGNSKIGYCKCGIILNSINQYCNHCGQRIDWSDEE